MPKVKTVSMKSVRKAIIVHLWWMRTSFLAWKKFWLMPTRPKKSKGTTTLGQAPETFLSSVRLGRNHIMTAMSNSSLISS